MNEKATANTKNDVKRLKDEMLIGGEITIGQYVGLNKEQLYGFAKKGYQLVESGQLEEAKAIFQGLVAADPYDSVFRSQLGGIHFRQKNLESAFKEYDAAIRFNLANVDALSGRGELFLMQGKYEEGVADLKRAVESDPEGKKQSSIRARGLLLSLRDAVENDGKKTKATNN